ncbi:NAD-dependent epimerase/dehydratase family protein [Nocardia transvalensis]|uniref:NAD-dependent epimerase/dehydratase family protein n=1 Tax=Nocardia transvalensis TaxID=37333 RepID=UPI0018955FF4|nr:NAD-dependent epimerase/dehydratase family protein [Nocardia transvalensis]MBF6332152.1 NAD-dependent epimerase/dehydratase family protein [Nocardia transvalensis]
MKVFVTGATGFLGRRVVQRLVGEGHEVVALVRGGGREVAGATVVTGDLTDVAQWQDRLSGIDAVAHLGGLVTAWAPWREYEKAIVVATRDLLAAAEAHHVRRFVYISSESVLQDGRPLLDITEAQPAPAHPSSGYGRAKLEAEQAIREHRGAIETIVLRPTFIWGRGSAQVADFADRARAGKLPLVDHGAAVFEHVHVDNVAAAVSAALTEGTPDAIYFVTNGEPMPVREFLAGVLGAQGAPMPRRSVPSRVLYPVARMSEWLWSALPLPGRPPITPFEVEFLSLPRRYDIGKARRELGYKPIVTYAEGIADLT